MKRRMKKKKSAPPAAPPAELVLADIEPPAARRMPAAPGEIVSPGLNARGCPRERDGIGRLSRSRYRAAIRKRPSTVVLPAVIAGPLPEGERDGFCGRD